MRYDTLEYISYFNRTLRINKRCRQKCWTLKKLQHPQQKNAIHVNDRLNLSNHFTVWQWNATGPGAILSSRSCPYSFHWSYHFMKLLRVKIQSETLFFWICVLFSVFFTWIAIPMSMHRISNERKHISRQIYDLFAW